MTEGIEAEQISHYIQLRGPRPFCAASTASAQASQRSRVQQLRLGYPQRHSVRMPFFRYRTALMLLALLRANRQPSQKKFCRSMISCSQRDEQQLRLLRPDAQSSSRIIPVRRGLSLLPTLPNSAASISACAHCRSHCPARLCNRHLRVMIRLMPQKVTSTIRSTASSDWSCRPVPHPSMTRSCEAGGTVWITRRQKTLLPLPLATSARFHLSSRTGIAPAIEQRNSVLNWPVCNPRSCRPN